MEENTLTKSSPVEKKSREKSKYINIFFLFVIISFISAFIIGGIAIGIDQYNKQQETAETSE